MTATISTTLTSTYVLTSSATQNPLIVLSNGLIDIDSLGAYVTGISGEGSVAWAVTNLGTVRSIGNQGTGIFLNSGGSVTNGVSGSTSAYIDATGTAVQIDGSAGTITNFGTVAGTGTATYHLGIYLAAGGNVNNAGLIVGGPALYIGGDNGTVTNSGTIIGTGYGHTGVGIGGQRQNRIVGGVVDNTGLIEGDNAVDIGYSGQGTGIVSNSGTILGTGADGSGVSLDGGGSVGNTGLIEGRSGVDIGYQSGTVTNSGIILGTSTSSGGGAHVTSGTIDNSGTISGFIGAALGSLSPKAGGGSVINQSSGKITGDDGIAVVGAAATVTNAGIIAGTAVSTFYGYLLGDGVFLHVGGLATNQTGGVITGVSDGVYLGAAGTISNSGTIVGAIGIVIAGGDTGSNTIVNFGTIVGTAGVGLSGGSGNVAFVQEPGAQFQGAIANFHPGDTIDLVGLPFAASASTVNLKPGNVLSVDENGNVIDIALINPTIAGDVFTATNDGSDGTLISEAPFTVGGVPPYAITDPLMTNTSGSLVFDQVAGGQIVFTTIGGLGAEWEFDGAGFFLNNGNGNPGFLIRDTGNVNPGALYVGEVVNGAATYTPVGGLGLEWQFEGNADFFGTGQSEFLIRNTGAVEPGTLDLGQVVGGSVQYTQIGGLGLEWEFDGTGDFLGDGRNGFLIRNTGPDETGALDVGEIVNGATQYTPIGGVGTEWDFEGTGDFLGDGHTGFLMWNSGSADLGAMAIGEVINGQLSFTDIGGVGPEWQFVGTGNYIDSNKTDFLLRNTGNGALVVASVAGTTGNATVNFTTVGGVGGEWTFHNTTPALMA